jgi:hypothetical protein
MSGMRTKRFRPAHAARATALGIGLVLLPVAAQAQDLTCSLTLFACDLDRDGTADCPVNQTAEAGLYAEGDSWNLIVRPLAIGPASQPPQAEAILFLMPMHAADDGTRFYYIAGQDGVDGAFTYAPTGAARLQLFRSGAAYALHDYFTGTCTEVTE